MTQPSSSELIDLAWGAAQAANQAFDRVREASGNLEQLHAAGTLGLSGVVIPEEAYAELRARRDRAQTQFDVLVDMAAPVMFMPESPFATGEVVRASSEEVAGALGEAAVDLYGSEIEKPPSDDITLSKLVVFANENGYTKGQATRIWRILERLGIACDPASLRATAGEWLENDPDITSLGSGSISFLADYLNHKLPGAEMLAVRHPSASRSSKLAEVKLLKPHELLFDRMSIDGEEGSYITHVSFARFLLYKDYMAAQHPFQLFISLVTIIDPALGTTARHFHANHPLRMNDSLVYMGRYERLRGEDRITYGEYGGTPLWGIAPDRFISLIEEAESSPTFRGRLRAYTNFSRPLVGEYVAALKEFLAQANK